MATTTATITVSSTDLLTDELALSSTASLTTAGTSTGVTQASGLSRKTTSAADAAAIQASVLIELEITLLTEQIKFILKTHQQLLLNFLQFILIKKK